MTGMLDRLWIGAKCRLNNFVEDFKHEEKGAAEIVAILLIIVVLIAVVAVFRDKLKALVESVFSGADSATSGGTANLTTFKVI